jgi:hypothetical protein
MKKVIIVVLVLAAIVGAVAYFAPNLIDRVKDNGKKALEKAQHDYAVITAPDGSTFTVELESWGADGSTPTARYFVFGKDGTGYIVGARNCTFINDPNVNIDAIAFTGSKKLNYSYVEAMIKVSNDSIINITEFEDINAATNVIPLRDADGNIYNPHSDNVLIKIKVN